MISGIIKEDYCEYVLYFICYLSDEFKQKIHERLTAICYGESLSESSSMIYSYRETVKEFLRRYKTNNNASEDRKKGLIGELLVHVILDDEERFTTTSPYFNMEERSFRKGYDIILFEGATNEIWIAEVKSGEKKNTQKNASSGVVGLINTAKNDLKKRLNESNSSLWMNAINAAKVAMSDSNCQKDAVRELLEKYADGSVENTNSSKTFNVVLAGILFHPMTEYMEEQIVKQKYDKIIKEALFNKVLVIAIQEETFEDVYNFLESEVK